MSLNTINSRSHVLEIEAIASIVERHLSGVKNAQTLEERLIEESKIISFFESFLKRFPIPKEFSKNDYVDLQELNEFNYLVKNKVDLLLLKLQKLAEFYIESYNTKVKGLIEINGSLRRARQKKAALDVWDREVSKWIVAEKFLNYDFLSSAQYTENALDVNTSEGVATLPIVNEASNNPKKISIISGNGNPGNSDIGVQVNNWNPENIFDNNANTWFEYERLDSGPCLLVMNFDFERTIVLNRIQVKPINSGDSLPFQIEDILFSSNGEKDVSVKSLIGNIKRLSDFSVKNIGSELFWQLTFLPIKCSSVKVFFKQESFYKINTIVNDGSNTERKRYPISINGIEFLQLRFGASGGIASTQLDLQKNLYAGEAEVYVFPQTDSPLYNLNLDFSPSYTNEWENNIVQKEDKSTLLLDGMGGTFQWRLSLNRNDTSFQETTSWVSEEIYSELKTESFTLSNNISPYILPLRGKPKGSSLNIIQPRVCRRTDDIREAVLFGRSPLNSDPGKGFVLPLPFVLDEDGYNLSADEMVILGNYKPLLAQEDSYSNHVDFDLISNGTGVSESIWAVDTSQSKVALQTEKPYTQLHWCFPSERLVLEQRTNGYYCRFDNPFDPDKDRIRISNLNSSDSTHVETLESSKKYFDLKHKNIFSSSISFKTVDAITFTKTSSLVDVKSDSGSLSNEILYYLDDKNGKLYLSKSLSEISTTGSSLVQVCYRHQNSTVLKDEQYDIWEEEGRAVGIILKANTVVTEDVTFTAIEPTIDERFQRIDVRIGGEIVKKKKYLGKTHAIDLPNQYIVKGSLRATPELMGKPSDYPAPYEVPFIDGALEFLGLQSMTHEETIEIESDLSGIVTFKLAAGAAWYKPIGVQFQDTDYFGAHVGDDPALVLLDGDYAISSDGTVTIKVPITSGTTGTLPGEIKYSYYYADPNFNSENLISVDYKNGYLFSSEEMDKTGVASISYKVAHYKAEYDIVTTFSNFDYSPSNNTVRIRTENLNVFVNNRLKIYYFLTESSKSLNEFKKYFSPILYGITFRFL